MTSRTRLTQLLAAAAIAAAISVPSIANAHGPSENAQTMMRQGQMGSGMMMQGQMGSGQMGSGQMGPGQMGPGQMGSGQMGPGQMGPGQMGPGQMGPGQMGPGQMGPGWMNQNMMGQGFMGQMGYGMSGGGMMMGPGMMGAVGLGDRVIPMPYIGVDDVRRFLQRRIELQGYSRLRVGKVEAKDDDTILAEIDTVDGALVQRLEIDRHSGLMEETDTAAAGQKK